jgi:hypothetical protein
LEGKPASGSVTTVNRELESLRQVRDQLAFRITQEKVDTAIPKGDNVQIIDPAEADPAKTRVVLETIGWSVFERCGEKRTYRRAKGNAG